MEVLYFYIENMCGEIIEFLLSPKTSFKITIVPCYPSSLLGT